jgi:hypothetical protein
MDTGFHETDLDKVALAVEAMKIAKQATVNDGGIGEDMNINLFCWRGSELVSILQLSNTHRMERDERLERLTRAACIKRQGWGVDSFTFVAEGYCSLKPSQTKNQDLAFLFAQPNSPVTECLSFTQLGSDNPIFISLPYKINVGRKVTFGEALWYSALDVMRDLTYAATLNASLKLEDKSEEPFEARETYFKTLADEIQKIGFEVFYRDDL